jgi:hypothetical protein
MEKAMPNQASAIPLITVLSDQSIQPILSSKSKTFNNSNFSNIIFEESELEAAIADLGVETSLHLSIQKSIAGYCMISMAMAMAINDDLDYSIALREVEGYPEGDEQCGFAQEFVKNLMNQLSREIQPEESASGFDYFFHRVESLLSEISTSYH